MAYNPHIHHRRSIRLKGYDYSGAGLYFITICCQDRLCRFGTIENGEMILNEFGTIAYNEWVDLTNRFPHFELDVFQIMPNHMHGIILLNGANNGIPVGAGFTPDQNQNDADNAAVGSGFTPDPNGQPQSVAGAGFTPDLNGQPQSVVGAGFTPDLDQNDADNVAGSGFTPDEKGRPRGTPQPPNENNIDNRAGASPAPTTTKTTTTTMTTTIPKRATIGDIVGAYKSLVANGCLEIFKSQNKTMGKLWQRDYYEHIIRNEQSYTRIANYIINNPVNWKEDKFYT